MYCVLGSAKIQRKYEYIGVSKLLKERSTKDCAGGFQPGTILDMLHSNVGYYKIHGRPFRGGRGEQSSHGGNEVIIHSVLLISSQIIILLSPYLA